MPRRYLYALAGAALAFGAPSGYFVLTMLLEREFSGSAWWLAELERQPLTYGYLFVSTTLAFAIAGYVAGRRQDLTRQMAMTDALTGLVNRRSCEESLEAELARCSGATPLSLLLVDVDGLKQINDVGGHEAGDVALRATSEALRASCRRGDVMARYGGDEFVIIAPRTAAADALVLAERLRAAAHEHWLGAPLERALSISIGIATATRPLDPEALIKIADTALYEAKRQGRDKVIAAPALDSVS